MNEPMLLTESRVIEMTGLTRYMVRRLRRAQRIRAWRTSGGQYRYFREEITHLVNAEKAMNGRQVGIFDGAGAHRAAG